MKKIVKRYGRYTPQMFQDAWSGSARLSANRQLKKLLTEVISASDDDYNGVLQGLINIADELPLQTSSAEIVLYRGSVINALATAYFLLCRTGNDADRAKFATIVKSELIAFIADVAGIVEAFYKRLKDPDKAVLESYVEIS